MSEPQFERILPLAALFQAGLLADEIATSGNRDASAMRPLMQSILLLDATSAGDVYPNASALEPGLRLVRDALTGRHRKENYRQVGHALSLIQLARVASRDEAVLAGLRHRLEALVAQQDHFPDITAREFCHRAAGVYTNTLSTLRYRIRVQGAPAQLQNEDNAATIRALFLAGIRAGFLWHSNGGRRWQLLLQRRRILEQVDDLLA